MKGLVCLAGARGRQEWLLWGREGARGVVQRARATLRLRGNVASVKAVRRVQQVVQQQQQQQQHQR